MRSVILSIALLGLAASAMAQDAGEAAGLAVGLNSAGQLGPGNTIWDEGVDGDLGDRPTPTPVNLGSPADVVIGNVGGTGVDFDDCFIFNVPAGNNVTSVVLTDYIADGGNTTSGFNIYTGVPPDPAAFGDIVSIAVGPPDVGSELLGAAGPLTGGDFAVCFLEGTPNQNYVLTIGSDIVGNVLPEPAQVPTLSNWGLAAMILLVMFGAVVVVMRKEQA